MKKKTLTVAIVMLASLFLAAPVFAELEMGVSLTPMEYMKGDDVKAYEDSLGLEQSAADSFVPGLHFGMTKWWLFYASWDAMIMPPWWIQQTTEYTTKDGSLQQGIYAPGFLNMINVGFRPAIGPVYIMASAGLNHMYIHSDYEPEDFDGAMGFNMKAGAGLRLGGLAIGATGTMVYGSFDQLSAHMEDLASENVVVQEKAVDRFMQQMIPSITLMLTL